MDALHKLVAAGAIGLRCITEVLTYLRLGFYFVLSMIALGFVLMIADRAVPMVILPTSPIVVSAGDWALIEVPIKRTSNVNCSFTYSRYLFDAEGARFDVAGGQRLSAETIKMMEGLNTGVLKLKLLIPPAKDQNNTGGILLGYGAIVTEYEIICNKAHYLHPIRTRSSIPIFVVP